MEAKMFLVNNAIKHFDKNHQGQLSRRYIFISCDIFQIIIIRKLIFNSIQLLNDQPRNLLTPKPRYIFPFEEIT